MKLFFAANLVAFAVWAISIVNIDLAVKKIPNAKVLLGGKLLLLALGMLAVNSLLGWHGTVTDYLNWNFYRLWLPHLGLSVMAGLLLWYSEVWPAGDAKFFILVSAWLPLINPFINNLDGYLFLSLLVNIFISASLFVVGNFLASGIFSSATPADFFREVGADIKAVMVSLAEGGVKNRAAAAAYLANLTLLFLLQQIVNLESRGFLSRFFLSTDLLYFILFFLWDKVGRLFKSNKWSYFTGAFYAVYFIAGYFFFYEHMAGLMATALVNVFKFSLLLFFGRTMLGFMMEKKDIVYLSAAELEPGIILSNKAAGILKNNPAFEGAFDDCFKDGLDEEQVKKLKEWLEKLKADVPKIEAVRGRPFALWIFAGACITLLFDRNLSALLK